MKNLLWRTALSLFVCVLTLAAGCVYLWDQARLRARLRGSVRRLPIMCGIPGYVSNPDRDRAGSYLTGMMGSIKRRRPDGEGAGVCAPTLEVSQ